MKKNSWYRRFFARKMSRSSGEYNTLADERKRALLGGLHGVILEIGPGTGPNLAYYPRDIQWIGVEPNPAMHPYLLQEARRQGIRMEIREGAAEHLPAMDGSVDAVVCTLVLCSVQDQGSAIKEALRVLKPGGQFVFIEHVAAQEGSGERKLQNFIRPLWQVFGDGCQPNRETWVNIEQAGFSQVKLEHYRVDWPVVGPHIAGVAIK